MQAPWLTLTRHGLRGRDAYSWATNGQEILLQYALVSIRLEWAPDGHLAMDIGGLALRVGDEVYRAKGLRLRVAAKETTISGGSGSEVLIPRTTAEVSLGSILDAVETRFDARAMATRNHGMPLKQVQALDAVLRVGSDLVRAPVLGGGIVGEDERPPNSRP
ncbi:MAG: hypothetical protein JWO80_5771 [Bryobacterales bacterium]|nr:hypothetical protein [Bryobacterales bacterium]